MDKAFTYIGDLSTALDYARWRISDIDAQVSQDETGAASPYLWDATYLSLFSIFGVREGMAQACGAIAAKISQDVTSFGESPGARFTFRDKDYYQKLMDIIRDEPEFSAGMAFDPNAGGRVGIIGTGVLDLPERNFRSGRFPLVGYWGGINSRGLPDR